MYKNLSFSDAQLPHLKSSQKVKRTAQELSAIFKKSTPDLFLSSFALLLSFFQCPLFLSFFFLPHFNLTCFSLLFSLFLSLYLFLISFCNNLYTLSSNEKLTFCKHSWINSEPLRVCYINQSKMLLLA